MDCGNPIFYNFQTRHFYVKNDTGECIPIQFPSVQAVGGGGSRTIIKNVPANVITDATLTGNGTSGMPLHVVGGGGSQIPFAVEINLSSTTGATQNLSAVVTGGTAPFNYEWNIKSRVEPNSIDGTVQGIGIFNIIQFPAAGNSPNATIAIGTGQLALGTASVKVTDSNGLVTYGYWTALLSQPA